MRARMRQDCEVLSITVLKGQDGPNEFGRHARMKRLLTLLSALALFGAFAIGATVVRADDISGQAGDDEIEGNQGDDDLCGDQGDDDMKGGPGNDVMNGGAGNDDLEGQGGNDLLVGG